MPEASNGTMFRSHDRHDAYRVVSCLAESIAIAIAIQYLTKHVNSPFFRFIYMSLHQMTLSFVVSRSR
jgi:hypothetical protein